LDAAVSCSPDENVGDIFSRSRDAARRPVGETESESAPAAAVAAFSPNLRREMLADFNSADFASLIGASELSELEDEVDTEV
jgi:hypothetical protein